jgi:hypothetical protein
LVRLEGITESDEGPPSGLRPEAKTLRKPIAVFITNYLSKRNRKTVVLVNNCFLVTKNGYTVH